MLESGAAFVALAAVGDAVLMAATIAARVGCSNASSKPPKTNLIECLRDKTKLLVLDNLEQIRDAAPLLVDLLAECPGLCVLATSRERLHLRAEQRFQVPPLDLAPAIELFVKRAQAVNADFRLTPQNQPALATICQRLDRLPLALELCAAQIDLLSPTQLLAQLHDRRLDLLVEGARDLPPRQRTLRTAIQHSYQLLDEAERTLLRRLGVFVGGFDLPTVAAVVADSEAIDARPLNATLHALIGKSLVRAETMPSDEPRFVMLETIREFALEQLRAQGGEPTLRERHYAAYLDFVRTTDNSLRTSEVARWLVRLHAEQDNIRAALQWTLDEQRYADTAWLIIAVRGFWSHNGQSYEIGQWIVQLLHQRHLLDNDLRLAFMIMLYEAAHSFETFQPLEHWNVEMLQLLDASRNMSLHANAWHNIALTYYTTDNLRALAYLERAIACARAAGTAPELDTRFCSLADHSAALGGTLWAYANALVNQGEFEEALPLLLESRDIIQQRGSRYEMASNIGTLGLLKLLQGDLARAHTHLYEAVAIATEYNYQWMSGFWQPVLGFVTLCMGDVAGARRILTKSLRLCTELKVPMFIARNMAFLAEMALWEGQIDEAANWLAQSLIQEADPGIIIIYEVIRLFIAAQLATAQQQYERAATLFGLAEQANSQIHHVYAGPMRAQADIALAIVRAALDPALFAEAFAAGQQLPLGEAFATVLHPAAIAA